MAREYTDHPSPEELRSPSSGDWYQTVVETCQEGILCYDPGGLITVWNRGMSDLSGLDREACVGRRVTEVFASVGVAGVEEYVARSLRGERESLQTYTLAAPGEESAKTYEADYLPARDAAGRIIGGMAIVRDVTKRTQVSQALIESERKHRLRFLHSADAILIFDRNGRYVDANPAAAKLTGYTHEQLLSMSIPALSVPEEQSVAKARFSELLSRGESRRERVIERKDGTRLDVEAHAIDLGDGTFQTSIRDIRERKQAEDELHLALQRLRFHIDRMPLGYIGWTREMTIAEWNPASERIFGWRASEIIGQPWHVLVPERILKKVGKIIDALIAGDPSSYSVNENVCKDGSIITCEWFNTPIRDSSGTVSRAASMVHDVTERELEESQLRHAQKLESLGILTQGIAHDFGNLLTVVLGNLKLLRNVGKVPPRAAEHLALIQDAATRASELTDHLLAFARTGRHRPERASLNKIIQDALKLVRASIASNILVEVNLDPTIPEIDVDRSQIEQVVLNLCVNAAQAMPGGGTVTVQTLKSRLTPKDATRCLPHDYAKPGPMVEMLVRDSGHGIDPSVIHRIFDPFFTTKPEGHGLGLAALLGILKQHGAHILTDSARGKGTTFRIFFQDQPLKGAWEGWTEAPTMPLVLPESASGDAADEPKGARKRRSARPSKKRASARRKRA